MIDEAIGQLRRLTSKITVSFVLVSSQQNVYDEFVKYLQGMGPAVTPKIPPTNKRHGPLKITYDEKSKLILTPLIVLP